MLRESWKVGVSRSHPRYRRGTWRRPWQPIPPSKSFKLYEDVGGIKATHKQRGGSHFLVIEDAHLRLADEKGYALVPGGVLMIPHTGGKQVKKSYVEDLV